MKLNGVVDQDGIVPLAVGDGNVIAVVVTAQDGKTTQSYSVTVTRARSADATLSALSLSGVDRCPPAFASGDDGVHGVGGACGGGDDGDGDLSGRRYCV